MSNIWPLKPVLLTIARPAPSYSPKKNSVFDALGLYIEALTFGMNWKRLIVPLREKFDVPS